MDVTGPISGREIAFLAAYAVFAVGLLAFIARKLGH